MLNIINNMCADESDSNMDRLTVIVHHSLATIISGQMKRQTLKTPIVKLKKLSIHQSVQTQWMKTQLHQHWVWWTANVCFNLFCITGRVIGFLENILFLASGKCRETGCDKIYHVSHKFCGCCLIVEGRCSNGHIFNWESSPHALMNTHKSKSYVDNLDFAAAIILSGNNFAKVKLFCCFLGLPCISKTTFHAYQRLFICPTIEKFYKAEQVSQVFCMWCTVTCNHVP